MQAAEGGVRSARPAGDNRRALADVLSVLAITTGKEGERESLRYRLEGSKVRPWDHLPGTSCDSGARRLSWCVYAGVFPKPQRHAFLAVLRSRQCNTWYVVSRRQSGLVGS